VNGPNVFRPLSVIAQQVYIHVFNVTIIDRKYKKVVTIKGLLFFNVSTISNHSNINGPQMVTAKPNC